MGELCYLYEIEYGYNATFIDNSILIRKNGNPWMQVQTKEQVHEVIRINNISKEGYK